MMITASSSAAVSIGSVPITKYPTRLHVRCICGHQGYVSTFIEKKPRIVCSKCGNRNPIVASRDVGATWSKQRKGR